jgi:hypothetical protein
MDEMSRQYERVARVLDGESIELTGAEQALLDEIRGELAEGQRLEVGPVPTEAKARARRRIVAAAAGRRQVRRCQWVAGAVSAAAVLLAAIGLWWARPDGPAEPPQAMDLPPASPETLVLALHTDPETQLLLDAAAEVEAVRSDLLISDSPGRQVDPLDRRMDHLDAEIETLLDSNPFETLNGMDI